MYMHAVTLTVLTEHRNRPRVTASGDVIEVDYVGEPCELGPDDLARLEEQRHAAGQHKKP